MPSSSSSAAPQLSKEEAATLRRSVIQTSIDNEKYLRAHPEVTEVLQYVLGEAMMAQPDEPVAFIEDLLANSDLKALHQRILAEREK